MVEPNAAPAPPSQPVALTPQQAQILLKADRANLAHKAQPGKTLSAAERNLMQSILGGGDANNPLRAPPEPLDERHPLGDLFPAG